MEVVQNIKCPKVYNISTRSAMNDVYIFKQSFIKQTLKILYFCIKNKLMF